MLAGDEWIGTVGWGWDSSRTIPDGDFLKDVLGVAKYYTDINYAATGDQNLPSIVYPQMSTALGGALYNLYNKVSTDSNWTLPMHYDPYYELSNPPGGPFYYNWLDGVDFVAGVEVFMKAWRC